MASMYLASGMVGDTIATLGLAQTGEGPMLVIEIRIRVRRRTHGVDIFRWLGPWSGTLEEAALDDDLRERATRAYVAASIAGRSCTPAQVIERFSVESAERAAMTADYYTHPDVR